MPHSDCKPHYVLNVNADEYRLITMALAGVLLHEDCIAAKELNVHLCRMRQKHLSDQAGIAGISLARAERLLEEAKTEWTKHQRTD